MTVIDLRAPAPAESLLLAALPRRLALTLPELRFVAAAAGDAPLPFTIADAPAESALAGRLGASPGSVEDSAYTAVLDSLRDPETSLGRRGLLTEDGRVDAGLLGAVGLLASPEVALDLDVAAGGFHARAWHRQAGSAVATLATADGIVFELAWFPLAQWPGELARAAVLPEDLPVRPSTVPEAVDLPFELADAAGEAVRSGRADLVPVLVQRHGEPVTDAEGAPLSEAAAGDVLRGLTAEARGRLRALVADVSGSETTTVGVVSWVLLADGWHALRPRHEQEDRDHRVQVRRVTPAELAAELAPILAEVLGLPAEPDEGTS
ncbi:hypothetical protein [Nocardioides pantholopis]|uniref:hypothetical protein n=1 Tax=Nocardioides pantholopis TaxID=2483798 RepID=UPI000FDAEC7C|nr:hypothetical protein [Nocardioides pantholopis]